jgi:hypothetical protein
MRKFPNLSLSSSVASMEYRVLDENRDPPNISKFLRRGALFLIPSLVYYQRKD